jgi:UDPglucose 6-dehydrogenase
MIKDHYGPKLDGKATGVWGIAFKPNTDDIREAPAITLIEELLRSGAQVRAFDPVAMENARRIFENRITFCKSAYEAAEGADALAIVTEWNEFRHPDFARIKDALKEPVIFDGRNLYHPAVMEESGFKYYGIGRKRTRNG